MDVSYQGFFYHGKEFDNVLARRKKVKTKIVVGRYGIVDVFDECRTIQEHPFAYHFA